MKYLFDHKLKTVSGWVFYVSLLAGIYLFLTDRFEDLLKIKVFSFSDGFQWIENGFLDEIFTFVIIVSGIVNSFSRESIEDELVAKIRMESLVLSLFINYGLLLVSNFFVFGLSYFYVMVFHLFSILIIFNLIYRLRLRAHYRSLGKEE